MFEVGEAKSATQSILIILTPSGLFQKNIYVFYFSLEISRQGKASPLNFPYNYVTPFGNCKA